MDDQDDDLDRRERSTDEDIDYNAEKKRGP